MNVSNKLSEAKHGIISLNICLRTSDNELVLSTVVENAINERVHFEIWGGGGAMKESYMPEAPFPHPCYN